MLPKVAAIIVSHDSGSTLEHCVQCLESQEYPLERIIVVDSGSSDRGYLQVFDNRPRIQLVFAENIGFSRANNCGIDSLAESVDFVLFVNPDLFLPPDFVQRALPYCENDSAIGVLGPKLLAYDCESGGPDGRIDSTGIARKWYGRWYDRGQGEIDTNQYDTMEEMPALCGALLFCRMSALRTPGRPVFDPDFFLYKEDIELCLRLGKQGWKIVYQPDLVAYHCRGWQGERAAMSFELRKIAAGSEVLLYKKHPSPYILWALVKYLLVVFFRV